MDSKGRVIQWISGRSLDDLEYVDDLALLSHSVNHIQEQLEKAVASVRLTVYNKDKTKIMKVKTTSDSIMLTNGLLMK